MTKNKVKVALLNIFRKSKNLKSGKVGTKLWTLTARYKMHPVDKGHKQKGQYLRGVASKFQQRREVQKIRIIR